MRGKKNPPLDLSPMPEGTPLTFDVMARAYLEDYVLQRYRTMNTARPRVEHLREVFGGHRAETITADAVRRYQLHRRKQGAEAATINRETSALSRMLQLAIRHGLLERMPLFPKRLEENPPRDGFFEHDEYLKVRAHAPASYQDVLDFAYYSGWRRNEILHLTWDEIDLMPARSSRSIVCDESLPCARSTHRRSCGRRCTPSVSPSPSIRRRERDCARDQRGPTPSIRSGWRTGRRTS